MSTQSIEAGRAFLKLMVDDKDFATSLKGALQKLGAFSNQALRAAGALAGVGAAITAPFAIATKVFVSVGSELQTISQRTGLTAQSLSELKFAAEQSGTSLDAIGRAAKAMQQNGLDPRRFDQVVDSISKISDPVKQAQAAFDTFGKGAEELIPMLANLQNLRAEAKRLHLTMDPEAAKAAEALGNAMNALKLQSQALSAAIGSAVAPSLQKAAEWMQAVNVHAIQFVKLAPGLIAFVAGVGATLSGMASALGALSGASKGIEVLVSVGRAIGAFASANPWVAVAVVATPIIAALGSLLIKGIADWLGYNDAATKAAEGVDKHAAAEAKLRDQMEKTRKIMEARAEASKRLYGDKEAAAKESLIENEMRRLRAADILNGIGPLTRLNASLSQAADRLLRLQLQTQLFASGARSRFDMTQAGALQNEMRKLEISDTQKQLAELQTMRFMSNPAALAATFGFFSPFGFAGGSSLASTFYPGYNSGDRRGRGLPGFSSPEQVLSQLIPSVTGPRGTFSGQLATQIFGGSGGMTQRLARIQAANEKMMRSLENIDRKMGGAGIGPSFKVGLA